MTPDTSGPAWRTPLAYYDREECCWRTSGVMFPSDWPTSSQTCPAWGMTRRGELFELPTPALPTAEPASSSLLPTPVVNDMGAGKTPEDWDAWTARMQDKHGNGNGHGPSLSIEAQRLLPTPVADHSRGLPQPGTDYASLPNAVLALLPTPRASDGEKGGPNQRGSSGDLMLPSAVQQFLPTPTSRDWKGANQRGDSSCLHGALLPTPTAMDAAGSRNSTHQRPPGSTANIGDTLTDAATVLTGARTRALSAAGSESPDDEPHDLLSLLLEAQENA